PMILTSPPFFSVAVMASKVASTAVAAAVFVIWALSATAVMSSFLVIGPILSFARTESTAYLPLWAESLPKKNQKQEIRSAILWRIKIAACTEPARFQVRTADAFTE